MRHWIDWDHKLRSIEIVLVVILEVLCLYGPPEYFEWDDVAFLLQLLLLPLSLEFTVKVDVWNKEVN